VRGGRDGPHPTADGRYLYYYSRSGIWRAPVEGTSPFRTGTPENFSDHPVNPSAWGVGPDGSYVIAAGLLTPPKPRLILNWFAELERRLPTR